MLNDLGCGNTFIIYRQLINILRASSEDGYTKFIDKVPEACRVTQWASVVEYECATDA